MISDPKLPFTTEPASVETASEHSPAAPTSGIVSDSRGAVHEPPPSRAHLWLRRASVLLFVFLCATLGVMLMILPWRPEWSENRLLLRYPTLRELISSGFVRGVVSGLGLLNVWIGFWEAIQYRED